MMRLAVVVCLALATCSHAARLGAPVNGTTVKLSAYEVLMKKIHDDCLGLCEPKEGGRAEVSSHCVTECEVELYRCHDHNSTVAAGKTLFDACHKVAVADVEKMANPPPPPAAPAGAPSPAGASPAPAAAAPAKFLLAKVVETTTHKKRIITAKMEAAAHADCKDACGSNVDSSCVPECQVDMYTCHDNNQDTADGKKAYDTCESETKDKYSKFGEEWDKKHPYFMARIVSAKEQKRVQEKCTDACGADVDSSCCPECQVELYHCMDHNRETDDGKKAYDECEAAALKTAEGFGKAWDEKHPYF